VIGRDFMARAGALTLACGFAAVALSATSLAAIDVPEGPHVDIRGAMAMGAVAHGVAEEFMNDHPDAVVTVSGGGTYRGLKSVIVGTADIAMATDVIPEDLAALASRMHVTLETHAVFSDAVVVVVNPKNPLVSLSMRQLRDIFSGKTVRWADLGVEPGTPRRGLGAVHGRTDGGAPDEGDIDVVTFEGNGGPYETFKNEVLGSSYVITPRAREVGYAEFVQSIGESTIGYVGLHQVGHLKALQIDGVVASAETVRSGRYPIARQLSIVVKKPASPTVDALVLAFLAKDKGQRIAESLGNVPVQ
jgi:phosphate transport system substrate-binding protein